MSHVRDMKRASRVLGSVCLLRMLVVFFFFSLLVDFILLQLPSLDDGSLGVEDAFRRNKNDGEFPMRGCNASKTAVGFKDTRVVS